MYSFLIYPEGGGGSSSGGGFGGDSGGYRSSRPPSVCYAFQRGECTRGDSCRFSHSGKYCSLLLPLHFLYYS